MMSRWDDSELEQARVKLDAEKELLDKTEDSRFPVKGGMDYQEGGEDFGEWDNDESPMSSLDKEKYELEGARHDMQMQKNFINPNEMEEDETGFDWQKGGEQEEDEGWGSPEETAKDIYDLGHPEEAEEQDEETVSFKKHWGDVSDLTDDEKDETVEFPKHWGKEEEPVEKWDKDDDIGRNYAEPTGDDEPLDDDSYWQGRMEEAEEEEPWTNQADPTDEPWSNQGGEDPDLVKVAYPEEAKESYTVKDDRDNLFASLSDLDEATNLAEKLHAMVVNEETAEIMYVSPIYGTGADLFESREAKLKAGYIQCPHCDQQFSNIQWLSDHIDETHEGKEAKASERIDEDLALALSMSGNPEYPPTTEERDALQALGLLDPWGKPTPAGSSVVSDYHGDNRGSNFLQSRPEEIDTFSKGTTDFLDDNYNWGEAFKEEDHPRDGGKFTTKGGGKKEGLNDSQKKELDKYVSKFGKTDKDVIGGLASWDKDAMLPPNILKHVKDSNDQEILDYVRSKISEAKATEGDIAVDYIKDQWNYGNRFMKMDQLEALGFDPELYDTPFDSLPFEVRQKIGGRPTGGDWYIQEAKATEEQVSPDTYYYDYSDYWKKGDAYQRSGLALQAGISTDLTNSEWDDLPADVQAKIRDAGYVTSYEATEGQGGTYGRSDYMLNPQHEDITTCIICGRNIDDHSNPNTDYRGMSGTAPATDHYFFGGDQGGSDDKYDFESKATESEWRVHTLTHGEIPVTLGEQADEVDAVNAIKRMYFEDGFIPDNEVLSVVKIGESLHGYTLYGTEKWTVEGETEDVALLTQLLDNELEEEEEGHDETEDIALITQLLAPESEFKEDEHPREDSGKFTSGGGGSGGKHSETSTKDIIKSIKGGSKDWHDWSRTEKNEELYAEMEKRNREVEKPTSKLPDKVFRDDPDAVKKMEKKVKYWEDQKDYWNKITKFPHRDYQTPNQLGDAKWFMGSNISTNLRDAKKKLEGIKSQQARGTDLIRKPTYKGGKKRFYYSEEPKGEPPEEPWQKGGEVYHTLEVGGMSQSFDTYEEMMEYYKNFPEGTWQYSEESKKKIGEQSPNSLLRDTEPLALPTGKNALDQTYGVSEPETPDGQDLTGVTVGEEEIIEKKFTPPKIHYYKQYPFGRRAGKQNPFGEAYAKETTYRCVICRSGYSNETDLWEHQFEEHFDGDYQKWNEYLNTHDRDSLTIEESYAKEQVSIDTMNQAHIWWDNKYPERQWSDMRIGDRQNAILAFLRDPTTTLNEGGQGSGRKPYASKDPERKDIHHVGWKNYGIDDYLEKAEKDYEEGKEQLEDPTPWASLAHLAGTTVKDILFPSEEQEGGGIGGSPSPAPSGNGGEPPVVDGNGEDEEEEPSKRHGILYGYNKCPEGKVYRDGKCVEEADEQSFADMTDKEMEELGDLESTPHISEEFDSPLRDQYGTPFPTPEGKADCTFCGKVFDNWDLLGDHITIVHNDQGRTREFYDGEAPPSILNHPDWTGYSGEAKANEGGKGSGKTGHQGYMKAIEEEHTYDFCENCSMITEQVNHKCEMCGKQVE